MDKTQIRDAATIILVRDPASNPRILMGQRGAKAAFMPNKFVFPGGALDQSDADISLTSPIGAPCHARLSSDTGSGKAGGLVAAAIRELWEETGLVLGERGTWQGALPEAWEQFAQSGHRPTGRPLHFVFRAITPPGRPRRFDARFFVADATNVAGDPDDFSAASDELSLLQWIPLGKAREFNLPFITEVVLAEIAASLPKIGPPASVPFFNNSDEDSLFQHLGGTSPLG